jgi:hypothetical protein
MSRSLVQLVFCAFTPHIAYVVTPDLVQFKCLCIPISMSISVLRDHECSKSPGLATGLNVSIL